MLEPFTELRHSAKGVVREGGDTKFSSGCGLKHLLEISGAVQLAPWAPGWRSGLEAAKANCALCLLTQPWPRHVHKAAFPVLPSPEGMEGSLPETQPVQAPGSPAMDTFWRRPLQSRDFWHERSSHSFSRKSGRRWVLHFISFLETRVGVGVGERRVVGGRQTGTFGQQCVPASNILALESNSKHHLVAEYLGQIIQLLRVLVSSSLN